MAVEGYSCLVRKSGVSTAVVAEPLSIMSSTSTRFRITAAARRVIDPNVDFVFKNGTTNIPFADIAELDYMNGEVTLLAPVADGSVSSLSFHGNYLPITTATEVLLDTKSFSLGEVTDMLGTDVFTGATVASYRSRMAALKDVTLEVTSIAAQTDLVSLASAQMAGQHVVTEVFFGNDTRPRFRGICLVSNIDREAAVEGLAETTIGFKIAAVKNASAGLIAGYTFKAQPG